jgi:hypothetical protein
MNSRLATAAQATSDQRFARVCLTPAKAVLDQAVEAVDGVLFEAIETTQRKFKLSDKEMSALLKISQPNYARRKYNTSRICFLNLDMRRYFIHCCAKQVGLETQAPTSQAQVKAAAKAAIVTLLDLMEAE